MSLTRSQAIITVQGADLDDASLKLLSALEPYPDARIVSLIEKDVWKVAPPGDTALLVVVEYSPTGQDE